MICNYKGHHRTSVISKCFNKKRCKDISHFENLSSISVDDVSFDDSNDTKS